jgi:hypothetical protein
VAGPLRPKRCLMPFAAPRRTSASLASRWHTGSGQGATVIGSSERNSRLGLWPRQITPPSQRHQIRRQSVPGSGRSSLHRPCFHGKKARVCLEGCPSAGRSGRSGQPSPRPMPRARAHLQFSPLFLKLFICGPPPFGFVFLVLSNFFHELTPG